MEKLIGLAIFIAAIFLIPILWRYFLSLWWVILLRMAWYRITGQREKYDTYKKAIEDELNNRSEDDE